MDLDNPSYFSVNQDHLTPPSSHRTTQRTNFARSLSNESNHQILRGEPRLSDLAPEIAAKRLISRQKNSLNYTSLDRNCDDELDDSGDEVFLDENTAKYYNFSRGLRRHSIGGFAVRDNFEKLPTPDSMLDDHSIRHGSFPRKRCNKCIKGTLFKRTNTMEDILIVSLRCSTAASLWVDYFTSYFQQIGKQTNRKSFKIHHLATEDFIEGKIDVSLFLEKSNCVKLQLVILCPEFLEYITTKKNTNFGKLFLPDRTLALLLGINDDDLNDSHKTILPTYFKWQRMSVGQDQDANFTKEFIGHAMTILAKIWKQQSSVVAQEKACFSVSPKKIRQGQNNVFILLNYPLQKDDSVKISVEKNNEMIEIKNVKRRNPYTIKITVPDNFTDVTSIINILVEKNGSIIGSKPIKCESRLRELEQILRLSNHPIELMCQTLGFHPADKENLDNWLVNNFQKNLPPHFNLLASHSTPFAAAVQAHKHSHEEFPTLLHFASKFGLEKLAMQLLDCPGADVAYEIRNLYDMTPAEIAEQNNHSELAAALRNFMNMSEFTSMYTKLKAISAFHSSEGTNNEETEYLVPRSQEDCYKVCPPPRPVTLKLTCAPPMYDLSPSGYTPMHTPSIRKETTLTTFKPEETSQPSTSSRAFQPSKNSEIYEDKVQKELLEIMNDFKNNVHSISQVEKLVDEWKNRNDVQKSFKEKQEQLKEMRLKYEKIQHEMKISLKKPSPFERIKKIFTKSQRTKNEIAGNVSKPVITSSTHNLSVCTNTNGTQRPVSSLSTSSSGSSGRMSTISGCSLGDSGTHSDNEERKNIMRVYSDDDFRNELNRAMMNLHYTPLPAPKPLKTKTKLSTTIIEESSNNNSNNSNANISYEGRNVETPSICSTGSPPSNDQYYIQFPPSGLPVAADKDNNESKNDYMNVKTVPDNNEDGIFTNQEINFKHEYMNYRTPTCTK